MSKNKLGLILGIFFALVHVIWSVFVALMPSGVESFMNKILTYHHISMPFTILTPFVLGNAVWLIVYALIWGYILGWLFAWVFNMLHKR